MKNKSPYISVIDANALDEVSTYLTSQVWQEKVTSYFIVTGTIWIKQLQCNIVNSAGGVMVQEIKPGFDYISARRLPVMDKTQQRSLTIGTSEILPSLQFTRVGPVSWWFLI